jgi:hypothetical protein
MSFRSTISVSHHSLPFPSLSLPLFPLPLQPPPTPSPKTSKVKNKNKTSRNLLPKHNPPKSPHPPFLHHAPNPLQNPPHPHRTLNPLIRPGTRALPRRRPDIQARVGGEGAGGEVLEPGENGGGEAWGADLAGGVVEELDPWDGWVSWKMKGRWKGREGEGRKGWGERRGEG